MKHLLQQFLLTLLFIGVGFQVTAATVTWDGGAGTNNWTDEILMSNKTTEKATVRTYPNPVTNQLTIEEFKGMVTIYNILGQPLKTFNVTNDVTSLPLSDLENGQYFIEMKANDGTKTVRQIVKIVE